MWRERPGLGGDLYTGLAGAGMFQQLFGIAQRGSGIMLIQRPYGDEIRDAAQVEAGFQYGRCRCKN